MRHRAGLKGAIITGGTSGIGLETAKALTYAGYYVIITGRDQKTGEQALAAVRAVHKCTQDDVCEGVI